MQMKNKSTLNESKDKLFKLMEELNHDYIRPIIKEQADTAQKLQRFLGDLGFGQMYYQYKNNPIELERVFSKLLKGRNLNVFLKLLHPQPSAEDKAREKQQQKDTAATGAYNAKTQEYNNAVQQLRKLDLTQLVLKYSDVFEITPEEADELFYSSLGNVDPDLLGFGGVEDTDELKEDWIEKIATKLVYGGKKPE